MAVRSPQDIYARHVSSSRGYPLWTPEPNTQLLSYRPRGLKIGDVGVVVPENGNFDVLFNICTSKDDSLHQGTGVPDGFSSIKLTDADIKTVSNAESAGQVLTTSSVTRMANDGGPVNGEVPPRQYSFNMSSSEGALLILPEGAERHDVRDPRPFFEMASRNAASWYHFAEENLGRIISHDSIYVITGFHKARAWGVAGYHNERGDSDFSAHFTVGPREGGSMAANYGWETTRNMDWRTGPRDGLGLPNQSVFIRGFKIALRSTVQGVPQRWVSYQPSLPSPQSPHTASGDSWLSNVWRGISRTIGVSSEETDRPDAGENLVRVEIQRIPEIAPVFHPSDVINQYILEKEPSAKVAITHDSDWGSILAKNLLTPEELVQDELLIKAISKSYTIVTREGVAHLQSKSGLVPFMDVDDFPEQAANMAHGADRKGRNELVQPSHAKPLSVVSESNYRCIEENASGSVASGPLAGLQSIPSKFGASYGHLPISPESLRTIKVIVISDYICSFCYICDKVIRDAIEACRDLPVRFDVEFRPFTLVDIKALEIASPNQVVYRNAYVIKRFGKEQADIKLKAVDEFAQKAGLELAEDSIVCGTTKAHRLSAKAYQTGGQSLQDKFNSFIFDACLAKGANIGEEDFLINAATHVGIMNKEEATEFLQSAECLDCVEKMVAAAKAQGINGVPFVIIDGKWAVNGLQPMECFTQIFRKVAQLPAPLAASEKNKTECELGAH